MRATCATRCGRLAPLLLLLACGTDPPGHPTSPAADRARLDDFPWSDPVWLGPVINSPARDLPGALSRDGLTLYLQSARTGSLGGDDIWISRRDCPTCEWKAPENLGAVINTAGFDGGPHLSRDGCLLFFSSVGHGAQAADVFVSWRPDPSDDFGWQPPVSLGPAVNSAGNDGAPALLQLGMETVSSTSTPTGAALATRSGWRA